MAGMGFSHYALIGWIMYNGDVNQTFEGDNNVLIQQTAKFLVKCFGDMKKGNPVMQTVEFLYQDYPESNDTSLAGCYNMIMKRAKSLVTEIAG